MNKLLIGIGLLALIGCQDQQICDEKDGKQCEKSTTEQVADAKNDEQKNDETEPKTTIVVSIIDKTLNWNTGTWNTHNWK